MSSLLLLLLVPGIVPALEPLKLGQGRGRGLVEEQRHGFGLLRFGHEHRVAAKHHRLVLHLVAVDPGEDFGQPWVGDAVGYPVQQVQMPRPPRLVVHVHHADALRADGHAAACKVPELSGAGLYTLG
uniref:Secreted protein n=1 Tax=Denticeps clupeoides TaxID=299321 RepID=A0AAY4DTA0_9TELE